MAYSHLDRNIWRHRTFKALSLDAQRLYLYLFACPHGNILGAFVLGPGYAMDDLEWSRKQFDQSFAELLSAKTSDGSNGLIKYDESCQLVLVRDFLQHNPIKNQNQCTGAIKKLAELPKSELFGDVKQFLKQLGKPFTKQLEEQLGKHTPKQIPNKEEEKEKEEEDIGEKLPPCPHQIIVTMYHETCLNLPQVKQWTKDRQQMLRSRWKEHPYLEWWKDYFKMVHNNPFLNGQNDRNWKATIDFLLKPSKMTKILEGGYSNGKTIGDPPENITGEL